MRIVTFNVGSDVAFVNRSFQLIGLPEMPKTGLIIDVRSNGGGLIWAGERLLQLLTPRMIEPCRLQVHQQQAECRALQERSQSEGVAALARPRG